MASFFHLGESIKVLYQQLEYSERKVIADEAEMKRHACFAQKNNCTRNRDQSKLKVCPWLPPLLQTDPFQHREEGQTDIWDSIFELFFLCWYYVLVLGFDDRWLFWALLFSTLFWNYKDIKVPRSRLATLPWVKLIGFTDANIRLPIKFKFQENNWISEKQ